MIPSLIEIKILVKRPISRTLFNKGLRQEKTFSGTFTQNKLTIPFTVLFYPNEILLGPSEIIIYRSEFEFYLNEISLDQSK